MLVSIRSYHPKSANVYLRNHPQRRGNLILVMMEDEGGEQQGGLGEGEKETSTSSKEKEKKKPMLYCISTTDLQQQLFT